MIIVIASWPKSGNTWLRSQLTNYISKADVDINNMASLVPIDSAKSLWTDYLGLDTGAAKGKEIFAHRAAMYRELNKKVGDKKRLFLKSHSANITIKGEKNFDLESIGKIIHVVRNPFDVLPSFANHMGLDIDKAWKSMQSQTLALNESPKQHSEFISSWDFHTKSFLSLKPQAKKYLMVRYEDMKLKPVATFQRIIEFIGMQSDENKMINALWNSTFENLKNKEQESGFKEAPVGRTFFRSGKIGAFKDEIPPEIIHEMALKYGDLLKLLGYQFSELNTAINAKEEIQSSQEKISSKKRTRIESSQAS